MSIEFFSLAPTAFQVLKAGESNPQQKKRIIYGQATSDANGIATLYFTDNQLANGNSLLTTVDYAVASIYSTNSSINARPRVQMREKNVTGKYVSANVTNISGVTVLGISVLGSENPMSGILVDFMILGSFK
ncbi:hypothetical protein P4G85_27635 [Bacillus cereus]|uniref:Uncharacterized protein n=2 Tax=Bacillus cereus group TaxID=86661 RepID=A0A9W5P1W9_BACCE|nr:MULTISPECIES: hypothetical protein [Bacillus cereus group]MEB8734154.1 hypothetical protein [Bacillus cereus]EEM44607.1 hypothetical protein bthur0005_56090 [Bacillus thuringiensis serovar pakistani str. T13001]EJR70947.1 hypothetical protein IK5_03306 [Bacillus cereus VD154]KIU74466.1 hypothetical protein C797_13293 [Bacillus thuringiensis Sbt003]MEB8752010.1 hypothetical protein [Bacillus cereus]